MSEVLTNAFDVDNHIKRLSESGISIRIVDGKLKVQAKQQTSLDEHIEFIRHNKQTFLNFLQSENRTVKIQADPENIFQAFPLTDIQRAYWVGHQQAFQLGDVSIHFYAENNCSSIDEKALEEAINQLVSRHDMLRTIIDEDGNQCILENPGRYHLEVLNLSNLSESEQQSRLKDFRAEWSHSNRSCGNWPGFSFKVVRLNSGEDLLVSSIDLIHVDGGSLLILFNELFRYYCDPAYCPSPLQLSFRDYALAEHELRNTMAYKKDLAFWKEQVKLLPPAPDLPQVNKPGGNQFFTRRSFSINAQQAECLNKQAAQLSLTPTVFVMSAFSEVLRMWNASEDFTLNVTLFNRLPVHEQINKIIGDFTSMILLPITFFQEEALAERAVRFQSVLWQSMEHRRVSGVTILNELNQHLNAAHSVQMPIVFTSLLDLPGQGLPLDWINLFGETRYTLTQTPQVSLDHQVLPLADGSLQFSWDAIEGLFPEGMISDMFDTYKNLVLKLLGNVENWRQQRLDIFPPAHHALYNSINSTKQNFGKTQSLSTLFRQSAEKNSNRIALVSGQKRLSYHELLQESEVLAAALQAQHITPGSAVAILAEKSHLQIIAVLACHAGAYTYVPIDIEQPDARIAFQLEQAEVQAVLASKPQIERARKLNPQAALEIESCLAQSVAEYRTVSCTADSLSHIIFTSGSTGKPKGVMIEHAQVYNRICDINTRFSISARDSILALTALHHDLSVYDIFGVLAAGGTVVIPDSDLRRDPQHWLNLLTQHQISLWNSVPAYLDIFLDYLDSQENKSNALALRFFILAGDWIPVAQAQRVLARLPSATFVASGGPTETTIWDIYNVVREVDPEWDSIPYGKPLANSQYYILDKFRNLCPLWVTGEMFIAGDGLTRGYINNPEQTAERYVSMDETLPVFKSGDLGRLLPDGNIEFIGRNDFQVKIRGLRIELPEIEKTAENLPQIKRAVALAAKTQQGPKLRLWLLPEDGYLELTHPKKMPLSVQEKPPEYAKQAQLSSEENDFSTFGSSVVDPSERLQIKLEYRALQAHPRALLHMLEHPESERENALRENRFQTRRDFSQQCLTSKQFSKFLSIVRAHRSAGELKTLYGSAGGLFPVQIYLHLKAEAVEGLKAGLYRYLPIEHAVHFVNHSEALESEHFTHNQAMFRRASLSLYFVLDKDAIEPLYGDLMAQMAYIEIGMMNQLFRMYAPKCGVGVCPIGALKSERGMHQVLNLSKRQALLASAVAGSLEETNSNNSLIETNANNSPEETNSDNNLEAANADNRSEETATNKADTLPVKTPKTSKCGNESDFIASVKQELAKHLPEYMLPESIEVLESLPLTANGKIDRKNLANRELKSHGPRVITKAANELEASLVKVFTKLLDLSEVSTEDRFFDLGANSALIVMAYHEFKKQAQVEFKLIDMFKHATIKSLVEHINTGNQADPSEDKSRLQAIRDKRNKARRRSQ